MGNKNWLVVAHRGGARIFCRGEEPHRLEAVARFEFPQAHLKERDFGSDRPGRSADSSRSGRHAMNNETPAREASAENSARQIADYLEAARVEHRLSQLALIAEPHMLGLLRAALSDASAALVTAVLDKDLVHVPDKQLAAYLEDTGFWI